MTNNLTIFFRCFLIGLLASSSFGPIFILTFNRGAIYGFLRGVATAFGACLADGIYFSLSLIGILTVLQESKNFMFFIDSVGGILLIILGINSLIKAKRGVKYISLESKTGIWFTSVKSFLLTALNPLVLFFFMVIGAQVLPAGISDLSGYQIFLSSLVVMAGSFSVLCLVALVASFLGSCISEKKLRLISLLTGIVFISIGIYFFIKLF
ncbi:LysE family transporter [Candidatus Babeliales bacterium]|nr:LysE family transporter [Candidatus Babeliales bacterium]